MSLYSSLIFILTLLKSVVTYVLSSVIERDHFPPHRSAKFEGYYTRVQLDDGGSLVLIFCHVNHVIQHSERKNLVHISYSPSVSQISPGSDDRCDWPSAFKYELHPDTLTYHVPSSLSLNDNSSSDRSRKLGSFTLEANGIGTMRVSPESTEYTISLPHQLSISLKLTQRTAWTPNHHLSSPMGFLVHLSSLLPLNWHVHSTRSTARYAISHEGRTRSGFGLGHVEKNWGAGSFPAAWLWTQSFGRREGETFCMAGGEAFPGVGMGIGRVHAYILGYRSSKYHWDFRPPTTMSINVGGHRCISPFINVKHDSRTGIVEVVARTPFRMLIARVEAPVDTPPFMGLACPLRDGHRPNFAFESFCGRTSVEIWQRRWTWRSWVWEEKSWQCVEKTELGVMQDGTPCSVLEFGGGFCHLVESSERAF